MLRWISEIGSGALIVTAASLGWSLWLRRQVRQRTAELETKNAELERESADRRQALEALQLTEKRLLMAMEAAQLRTWHWDIAADRFEVVGARPPELGPPPPSPGSAMAQFLAPIHHDDIGGVRATLAQAIRCGDPISTQFRVLLPNGTLRWKVARGCAV